MEKTSRLQLLIFSLIGVFNTLFDLALYVVIYNVTHSVVIANIVSTSAALIGSYFLNARLTFKNTHWTAKRFSLFVAVTLSGLWVLQTLIILALNPVISGAPAALFNWLGGFADTARTLAPKILATGVTFVWNYLWYGKVIFKGKPSDRSKILASEPL